MNHKPHHVFTSILIRSTGYPISNLLSSMSGTPAEDINGDRISGPLQLDANGSLTIEVKTGNAGLTCNQSCVYEYQVTNGNVKAVGKNSIPVGGANSIVPSANVVILRPEEAVMTGYLKTEIQNTLERFSSKAAADGWKYAKSSFKFTKTLGPGLTLVVHLRLTFTDGGLFCLPQPMMLIRSQKYETLNRKIFGKKTGPLANQGPVSTGFWLQSIMDNALTDELKDRYLKNQVQFIEMEVPHSKFTPENGYFQSEEIDHYIAQLLKSAENIANLFSPKTEETFIESLPRDIINKQSGQNQFPGSVLAYCIIELMKGNEGICQEIQDNTNIRLDASGRNQLNTIIEKQDELFG